MPPATRVVQPRVIPSGVDETGEGGQLEGGQLEGGAARGGQFEASQSEASQFEARQLEARQLEASQFEARQLEARQLEASQSEASQLEARQLEARQFEASQLEARQLEASQFEASQLEARQSEASQSEAPQLEASQLEARQLEASQLEMFRLRPKEQQKLGLLLELLGPLADEPCLLLTHGDSPGSLHYHLRQAGGAWSWAELEAAGIPQMEAFLGNPVHLATPTSLPFESGAFDRVVVVDVHEHLDELAPLNREIMRVLRPQGVAIVTAPNGDPCLPLMAVRRWIGLGNETCGRRVQGYTTAQLTDMLTAVELQPLAHGAYSRFFTEFAELAIHFGHVKLMAGQASGPPPPGGIAPRSAAGQGPVAAGQGPVGRSYTVYRAVFGLIRALSRLDGLIPRRPGYAMAVVVQKP
jgi:SAM-dependent methyltransferase